MSISLTVPSAYEWSKLPAQSVIVDVGGGIGSESLQLVREFPYFRIVVQDLPAVIEEAKKASCGLTLASVN